MPLYRLHQFPDTEDKVDATRFFVTIGEMDGANEKEIEKYVISKANITKEDIVDIKVLEKFSFVEVKKQFEQNILSLKDMRFNGRKINVEVAGDFVFSLFCSSDLKIFASFLLPKSREAVILSIFVIVTFVILSKLSIKCFCPLV